MQGTQFNMCLLNMLIAMCKSLSFLVYFLFPSGVFWVGALMSSIIIVLIISPGNSNALHFYIFQRYAVCASNSSMTLHILKHFYGICRQGQESCVTFLYLQSILWSEVASSGISLTTKFDQTTHSAQKFVGSVISLLFSEIQPMSFLWM